MAPARLCQFSELLPPRPPWPRFPSPNRLLTVLLVGWLVGVWQMASTAGSVAVGSVVGHGLSNMLFGGGSSHAAAAPEAPVQQQSFQERAMGGACEIQAKDFTQCLSATSNDMSACNFYLEALKVGTAPPPLLPPPLPSPPLSCSMLRASGCSNDWSLTASCFVVVFLPRSTVVPGRRRSLLSRSPGAPLGARLAGDKLKEGSANCINNTKIMKIIP